MFRWNFILFFLTCVALATGYTLQIEKGVLVKAFQSIIPTNDGSVILQTDKVSELMLSNILNNLSVLGVKAICHDSNSTCELDLRDEETHLKIVILSIIGNFVNGDLDEHDSLAHLCIDTHTGLLKRVYKSWWTRLMLTDTLLVITVTLLAKRVWGKEVF